MKLFFASLIVALALFGGSWFDGHGAQASQVPPGGGFPPCNAANSGLYIYVNGFRFRCIVPNWTYSP